MNKPWSINEDKLIKPCIFIGSLGSFLSLFVLGSMHGYAIMQERMYVGQIQWYYPEMINQDLMLTFLPCLAVIIIGIVPGIQRRKVI